MKVMSLRKASNPATLKERLVTGALQPSMVKKALTVYEPRDTPEVPNHVKDMATDEELLETVANATVAGAPVQTGAKETVGMATKTVNDLIDIVQLLSVGMLDAYDGDTDLMTQAEAVLDEAEVRDGLRRGHMASGTDTFNQVCGDMNVSTQLRPCFWQWLQSDDRPGPMYTPDQIPRKGGKVVAGLRVPRPDGALWRKLRAAAVNGKDVSDRVNAFSAEMSDT